MVGDDQDWGEHAACRTADPDELFVEGAAQNKAKAICTGCPVRTECLTLAVALQGDRGSQREAPHRPRYRGRVWRSLSGATEDRNTWASSVVTGAGGSGGDDRIQADTPPAEHITDRRASSPGTGL
ncbi:WhiB family transcriptional regulator [Streptomyces fungicidicus]|uniref:WhiB family transcriptional regulator n=1 Tax=Streptomyces fungicidicus TaxID=68203 RepID=UPI0033E54611